jgi:hypothetical protein
VIRSLLPFSRLAAAGADEAALTEALYQRWFIAWRAPAELAAQSAGDHQFVAGLSAVAGSGGWLAPGWRVTLRSGPNAFVSDGSVQLYVDARHELWPKNPKVGSVVHLRMPCARDCATPGFFLLVSRQGRAPQIHDKLYLHLTPRGGRAVIDRLRRLDACFEVKVANAEKAYGRRDSGVVYVDPRHTRRLVSALRPLTKKPGLFRASVPPVTKRIARGLAVAEPEPAGDEDPKSFGDERCRLVAKALIRSGGGSTVRAHLREVFAEARLDFDLPWRRAR